MHTVTARAVFIIRLCICAWPIFLGVFASVYIVIKYNFHISVYYHLYLLCFRTIQKNIKQVISILSPVTYWFRVRPERHQTSSILFYHIAQSIKTCHMLMAKPSTYDMFALLKKMDMFLFQISKHENIN